MTSLSTDVLRDLAPDGRLRAAINFGNPVLAQRDAQGKPQGVAPELARELAKSLSVSLELVPFQGAGEVVAAASRAAWDVAFLAIDPARAAGIAFTAPYVVIEGTYIVRDDSPLRQIDDFDRAGVRIAVGKGAAYDLFLTRTLKLAELVRAETSAAALELFVARRLEAAAGVRQPLVHYAATHPGLRVIDGRFTAIEQAAATPKGREAGLAYLSQFIEEMKATGIVADRLQRSGQRDVAVAPPA